MTDRPTATPPPDPVAPAPPGTSAPGRGRAVRRWLGGLALAVVVLVFACAAALWWAVRSEAGSAWVLAKIPGLRVEAPQGRLLGDFSARRLAWRLPGGRGSVAIDRPAWRGLRLTQTGAPVWLTVTMDALSADRVAIVLAPGPASGPPEPPADLRLPVEVDIRSLRIGELLATPLGTEPLRDLATHLHLGANGGSEHRLDDLALSRDRLVARGNVHVATTGSMRLGAALGVAQPAQGSLPGWSAAVSLVGPLVAPDLQATLRAEPLAGAAPSSGATQPARAQALDARATLHPFAAWPLGALQASGHALDLSAFARAAPTTALDFTASATTTGADRPAAISVDLTNADPGRWDASRLPLRRLTIALAARPDHPEQLDLRSFDAELGTERAPAGRVRGQGRWSPTGWEVAATLDAVQPALLDARAPAMPLSGPVTARGAFPVDVTATLAGTLQDRGIRRAVVLRLDAGLSPDRIDLREARASAGGAQASLSGRFAQAAPDAPWTARAQAVLAEFDPATWWPGAIDSPWRKAPSRLNANASVDLAVPPSVGGRPWPELLGALVGQASVHLARSVLLGVPLTGQADWHGAPRAASAATLQLDIDGNAVGADGHFVPAGNGSADAWNLRIDANALDRLAPLYRAFQPAGADRTVAGTLAGRINARAHVTGRWPQLSTEGQLDADALHLGTVAVKTAQARWTFGTSAAAPVQATVRLSDARLIQAGGSGPSIESMDLGLDGNGRSHTLTLRAVSRSRPPAWTDAAQPGTAASPTSRTVASVQAQGGLVDLPGHPLGGWHGTVQKIDLRSDDPGRAPLFDMQNAGLDLQWAGGLSAATLQPGRADVLGGAVRWSRIAWQAAKAGGTATIDADAELEPLHIAPLLARVQPAFGWGGDLTVAGHVRVHSAPRFSADVVLERHGGDLTVTDELGTRALGLTDLRLGLAAADGTWSFTQGLAGQAVGVLAGAEVVRTSPEAVWPAAQAPLQGVLELRVDDLGAWGSWVPAGWRLGGALHTSASFGGRFGAPEYTGTVVGRRLAVRNFLQGVNVTDGDLLLRLQGRTAHIERFTAKGGNGTIDLRGDADFGDSPQATLELAATKFQLLGRVDRRIVASGRGKLRIDAKTLALSGDFGVDEGLVDFTRSDAPALSDDVVVHRAADVPSPAAAASAAASPDAAATPALPTATATRQVALDLRVNLGQDLQVRGRGLDAKLRGDLRLTSAAGRLAVDGTVRAEEGTYAAYGQKLAIDRGLIVFTGPVDNPRLDIEATRPDIDVRVGVVITGTPTDLRIRLFSEPDMSDIDKLSWLMLGKASDGLGGSDTALLQRAALALFAGEGGGTGNSITKALGLDDISLGRKTDGDVTQTVLALGKQLTKRWYVGYERGLNATTGSFQLIYRIAQRFTLRMQSGDDTSVDLIWTWRWR